MHGDIAYPFLDRTTAIGENGAGEKFVIRTISGGTEYVVEIPGAARDYDVEVPIADLTPEGSREANSIKNPQVTDKELVASFPKLQGASAAERALMDKAFGVGEDGGPSQAPSYTMGISKINKYYKERNYEYALIEINNLLAFYPTSIRLQKMKGTVLVKLGNFNLAEKAWVRAAELKPDDPIIKKGLGKLREKIAQNRKLAQMESQALRGDAPAESYEGTSGQMPENPATTQDPAITDPAIPGNGQAM